VKISNTGAWQRALLKLRSFNYSARQSNRSLADFAIFFFTKMKKVSKHQRRALSAQISLAPHFSEVATDPLTFYQPFQRLFAKNR
jgi:hypothetical protein